MKTSVFLVFLLLGLACVYAAPAEEEHEIAEDEPADEEDELTENEQEDDEEEENDEKKRSVRCRGQCQRVTIPSKKYYGRPWYCFRFCRCIRCYYGRCRKYKCGKWQCNPFYRPCRYY